MQHRYAQQANDIYDARERALGLPRLSQDTIHRILDEREHSYTRTWRVMEPEKFRLHSIEVKEKPLSRLAQAFRDAAEAACSQHIVSGDGYAAECEKCHLTLGEILGASA